FNYRQPLTRACRKRAAEPLRPPARLMSWASLGGQHMHLRWNSVGPGTRRNEDYRLGTAAGIAVAAYAGFFLWLYWLMQPIVVANPGLAGYHPPPKTIVRYADSPWVPPDPSEPFPIRATREPA